MRSGMRRLRRIRQKRQGEKENVEARASTTDPEVQHEVQRWRLPPRLHVHSHRRCPVALWGVDVTRRNDFEQMPPMLDQLEERYNVPDEILMTVVLHLDALIRSEECGCKCRARERRGEATKGGQDPFARSGRH